jgi:hypothetical protein
MCEKSLTVPINVRKIIDSSAAGTPVAFSTESGKPPSVILGKYSLVTTANT